MKLEKICTDAMELGKTMDLSDCPYGETTGPCAFIKRPANYYFFLSGFVRLLKLTQILEIGTNSGGSIMAINKGINEDDLSRAQLVTIDIVLKNDEGFKKYPGIVRIEGNSLDENVVRKSASLFKKNIDLLYIDSLHEYDHTKENIDTYSRLLNPEYIILDDIRQCDDMRRLWSEVSEKFGESIYDASNLIGRKGAGFGVIKRNKRVI